MRAKTEKISNEVESDRHSRLQRLRLSIFYARDLHTQTLIFCDQIFFYAFCKFQRSTFLASPRSASSFFHKAFFSFFKTNPFPTLESLDMVMHFQPRQVWPVFPHRLFIAEMVLTHIQYSTNFEFCTIPMIFPACFLH